MSRTSYASGRKRTICIDRDGGFQMNCQELETICHRLPVKFFVLNDDGYASIRTTRQRTSSVQHTSPKLSSFQRLDDSFASRPLEDLWPFLDPGEFRANMIVPPLED